jgi:hypothetical protein
MMQQSHGLGIFCDIINDEMDAVKGVEKLTGLAAITPEFIKSWSVSGCKELAPTLTQILLSAAETPSAKEKTRLGGDHPDYYTLHSALTQVLHGLLLNAWRRECGFDNLKNLPKIFPSHLTQIGSTVWSIHH